MKTNHRTLGIHDEFIAALTAKNAPQRLAEWVDRLPWYDPVQLVNDLELPILFVGRHPVSALERFELIETLVRPLRFAKEALERHDAQGLAAGGPEAHSLAFGLDVLLSGFVLAYQRVLDEEPQVGRIGHWLHQNAWPTVAHRLVSLLVLQMETRRALGRSEDRGFWSGVARLAQLASSHGWTDTPVPQVLTDGTATLIEFEFRRLLLWSLIPSALEGPAIREEVEALMERWVHALRPLPAGTLSRHFRGIGLVANADRPPMAINLRDHPAPWGAEAPPWALLLDTRKLDVALAFFIDAAEKTSQRRVGLKDGRTVGLNTLRQLRQAWLAEDSAEEPRVVSDRPVNLRFGFTAIHHALNEPVRAPVWPRIENPPALSAIFKPTRKHYCNLALRTVLIDVSTEIETHRPVVGPAPLQLSGSLVSQGVHTMGVTLHDADEIALPIGQLIAVDVDRGQSTRLTEIRARDRTQDGTRGIELCVLCDDPMAVRVRIQQATAVSEPIPAFVGVDPDGRPVLVLPSIIPILRKVAWVQYSDRETAVSLRHAESETGHFGAYHFDIAQETAPITRNGRFGRDDIVRLFTSPRAMRVTPPPQGADDALRTAGARPVSISVDTAAMRRAA